LGVVNPSFVNPVGNGCTPGTLNYNALYTVDKDTGAFTLIGATGAPQFFMDLTFDREGNMYGVTCDLFPSQAIFLRCTGSTALPGRQRRSSISWEASPLWGCRSTGIKTSCMRPTSTALTRLS